MDFARHRVSHAAMGSLARRLWVAWRAGIFRQAQGPSEGSVASKPARINVPSLFESARSVSGELPHASRELALFVSDSLLCPLGVTEVAEYATMLHRVRPDASVMFLLLDTDPTRARHFTNTRALNMPVLYDAAPEVVADLNKQTRRFVSDFAPSNITLPEDVMPAMLVLLDTVSGELLGREFIFDAIADPRYKLLVLEHFGRAADI